MALNVNQSDGTYKTLEGRVVALHDSEFALGQRSGPVIIRLADVIGEIEEIVKQRKKRVVKRYVRVMGPDENVKQHLADRHAIFVDLLNVIPDDDARAMHSRIAHDNLGHIHGERPSRPTVSPGEAAIRLEELEEADDDGDELE